MTSPSSMNDFGFDECSCGNYFNSNLRKGIMICDECYKQVLKKDKGLVDKIVSELKDKFNVTVQRKKYKSYKSRRRRK